MKQELGRPKLLVTGLGISLVIYSVMVLGYVGTAPDLGLRGLLSDSELRDRETQPTGDLPAGETGSESGNADAGKVPPSELRLNLAAARSGMLIRIVSDELECKGSKPQPGDVLTKIQNRPIRSFLDFSRALHDLRDARIEAGGQLDPGTDPLDEKPDVYPELVVIGDDRWVEVDFVRLESGEKFTSWLMVQSLPLGQVLLSVVWLVLQFVIFNISALAAWHRPFDRSARLFFGMCGIQMGAFIGGFHWWVITAMPLLNLPFLVLALLVPAASLTFFLNYPRPLGPMIHRPKQATAAIYAVPVLASVVMASLYLLAWWLTAPEMSVAAVEVTAWCLSTLRFAIYTYLAFAGLCFFVMLFALTREYITTSGGAERKQMQWMLGAGLISAIPICYTLYLALVDQSGFALGRARMPMFLASVSFMLAYSIGIARFKLMLVDQVVSRGMLYYTASQGLTIGYGVCVALVAFFANDLNVAGAVPGRFQQLLSVGVLLTFSVVVLTWSRDRLQQSIDRRFYREKYQLDKALQRVSRAINRMEDRETLGQRMLGSCREFLAASMGALYLREPGGTTFQLASVDGPGTLPEQFRVTPEVMQRLKSEVAIQRASGASDELTEILRLLKCELLFPLESDGDVEGIVALARRQDGTPYTAEDLTFLNTLGQFTSVALRSVQTHLDFARLNEELRLKANRIDEQRQQIAMMQSELTTTAPAEPASPQDDEPQELRRGMIRGNSPAIREVLETVGRVAASESTVLIQGASGTGKELLTQALHENSPRRSGPMVRVHCAALSPSLLESELFGHVKGSFTGAHRDRIGRFEMANGGTLFLDEIGDISLETQIKLLRVLQTRSFEPVGGTRTIKVDVRLITATHQDLHKMISQGRFREDLFYRLNVVNITLPTLQERREDVLELSLHFLKETAQRAGKSISHIESDAVDALMRYDWPGNIRELENVIERAVVLCAGDHITLNELPNEVLDARPKARSPGTSTARGSIKSPPDGTVDLVRGAFQRSRQPSAESEVELLSRTLAECGGNKSSAARQLGIPRSTLFSRLKKAGLS
jgi:transcriptional regulator with GAF, ATPase, and Fis domain